MNKLIFVIPFFLLIQPAFADVLIQNDQHYIGDDDISHVLGEIENNSNYPLNQIKIMVKLFDENGFQIGQVNGKSFSNVIMPSMTGAFDIVVKDYDSKIIHDYNLEFNYKLAEPKNQVIHIVSSEMKRDSQNNLVISGVLKNQGEMTANMINVIASLYDRDGNVVNVSSISVQPDFLRAGDDSFFMIPIHEKSQSVETVDYTLIAESDEYTVVPEFPLGSGALLIASVSSYIILSRNPEKIINSISKVVKIISF